MRSIGAATPATSPPRAATTISTTTHSICIGEGSDHHRLLHSCLPYGGRALLLPTWLRALAASAARRPRSRAFRRRLQGRGPPREGLGLRACRRRLRGRVPHGGIPVPRARRRRGAAPRVEVPIMGPRARRRCIPGSSSPIGPTPGPAACLGGGGNGGGYGLGLDDGGHGRGGVGPWVDTQTRQSAGGGHVWWARWVRRVGRYGWVIKKLCFWQKRFSNCDFYGRSIFFVITQPDGWVRREG
jgi:hypothetical protein